MRLEEFFEKFELLAEAPGSVGKMRELVLEMAVRGRLFGKTEADKLPRGWHWRQFGEVAQFINGDRSKNYPSKHFRVKDGVPFINAGHLSNGDVTLTDMDYITLEHFDRLGGGKVERGDILYCLRGSLGKCAIVQSINRGAIASSLVIIRPSKQIISKFIYLYLASPLGARMISKYDNGSAQPNLSAANVKKYVVPLPPLAEQQRIVAKVDELMALCDRLEAQEREREARRVGLVRAAVGRFGEAPTVGNLELLFHPAYAITPADLRKTILTLAVQGKLVRQDPDDEPAHITFPKLASAAIESVDDEVPPHWLQVPLGSAGEWRGGGTPSKSRAEFWDGVIPWVSPKDMKVLHISDAQDHISQAAVKGSSVRMIPPGSLLMVVRGMILARAFPVALATREVTINQDMKALLPLDNRTKDFLLIALRAFEPEVLGAIEHSTHGTCKLATEFLQDFAIPLPPLAEQRRIVSKVDQLMALVDRLEAQIAASRETGARVLEAVVAELTQESLNHAH